MIFDAIQKDAQAFILRMTASLDLLDTATAESVRLMRNANTEIDAWRDLRTRLQAALGKDLK